MVLSDDFGCGKTGVCDVVFQTVPFSIFMHFIVINVDRHIVFNDKKFSAIPMVDILFYEIRQVESGDKIVSFPYFHLFFNIS